MGLKIKALSCLRRTQVLLAQRIWGGGVAQYPSLHALRDMSQG